jgi:hypothetical protein
MYCASIVEKEKNTLIIHPSIHPSVKSNLFKNLRWLW